ncbi:MAG: lipopolysaccharide transport periplasmic protein LptA [Thalassotalea sp.]
MCKLYIKKILVNITVIAATCFPLISAAATDDASQEILIKAKRQAADLKNKIASYLDDVVISQGSLTIKADLVQVITQAETADKIYVAKGKPAQFKQTLADGTPITLEAEEIRYEPGINTLTIKGNAKLSQEGSQVSGDTIIYNIKTEQLEAEGNLTDSVTTILQPQLKSDKK